MMYRRTVDEDESASDWDDMSSKESARASLTPNAESSHPHRPKGISSSPQAHLLRKTLTAEDKASQEHGPSRTTSNSSKGIQGQSQIAVELSHAPPLELSQTPHSTPRPTPPVVSNSIRSPARVELAVLNTADKEATQSKPFYGSSASTSQHMAQGLNSDGVHLVESHIDVPMPHPPPPPISKSHDQHTVHEMRRNVGRGGRIEMVGNVMKLEETAGEDEESNAFGIPEEMNMTITDDNANKNSVRLDLEFCPVSLEKTDSLFPSYDPPRAFMGEVATRWEKVSARGVEEVCSLLRLFTDFLIAVLLGSAYCILHHVVRKLLCGLGHLFANSIYKPGLTLCFNGFMGPCLQLYAQLSKGLVVVIKPLLEVLGVMFSWLAHVCRAIRLINITYKTYQTPSCA